MEVKEDAYREKVLRSFFHLGRLKQFPAQLKKRQIVLERIVQEFEPDRDYASMKSTRSWSISTTTSPALEGDWSSWV